MSIFNDFVDFFKTNARPRTVEGQNGLVGIVFYDKNGDEHLVANPDATVCNTFSVATIKSFQEFIIDIPRRFPHLVSEFRELAVHIDSKATPYSVSLSTPYNKIGENILMEYGIEIHEDFKKWFDGKKRTQAEFRRMLVELQGQHDQDDLIQMLGFLEMKTEVTFEASVETERNYVLGYKEKDGKSGMNIPKQIVVETPVIEGSETKVQVVFDLVIKRPTIEDMKIVFWLQPAGRTADRIAKESITQIVQEEILEPARISMATNGVMNVSPIYVNDEITKKLSRPTDNVVHFSKP